MNHFILICLLSCSISAHAFFEDRNLGLVIYKGEHQAVNIEPYKERLAHYISLAYYKGESQYQAELEQMYMLLKSGLVSFNFAPAGREYYRCYKKSKLIGFTPVGDPLKVYMCKKSYEGDELVSALAHELVHSLGIRSECAANFISNAIMRVSVGRSFDNYYTHSRSYECQKKEQLDEPLFLYD